RVPVHLGPMGSALCCAAAEPLEDSRCSGDERSHTQPPFLELALDVVDAAEALPRLRHDLTAEQLAQSHQAPPGSFVNSLDQRSSPRLSRSSAAVRFSFTTEETDSTSDHGTCTASPARWAASRPSSPRVRQALPPTRISATCGVPRSKPPSSSSSTLPQFRPSASTSWGARVAGAFARSKPPSSTSSTLPQFRPSASTSWWSRIPSASSTGVDLLTPGPRSSAPAVELPRSRRAG